MKKIVSILAASASLFLVSSCNKEDLKINFPINAAEFTFNVPMNSTFGPVTFQAHNLSYNLDSLCIANSCNLSQITSVKLKEAIFTIEDPDLTTNFDVVDWADGYLESAPLPKIKIAGKNPNPKTGGRVLALDLPDVELVEYVKKQTVSCFAMGNTNAAVSHDIPVRCRIKFEVTAMIAN